MSEYIGPQLWVKGDVKTFYPLLVQGEEGLGFFVRLVKDAWAQDRDFVIDLIPSKGLFSDVENCRIEFRRGVEHG